MTWMPADQRPIEPGAYEVKISTTGQAKVWSFWDGTVWHELRDTPEAARLAGGPSVTQEKEWRAN